MVEHKEFISLVVASGPEHTTRKISIDRLIGPHGRESDIESGKDAEKKKDKVISYGLVLGRKASTATVDETSGDFSIGCISRAHAQINISNNGHVYITDLGSRHGTFIIPDNESASGIPNKIRVLPFSPVQLLNYDTIVLGRPLSSKEGNVAPLNLKVDFRVHEYGKSRASGGRKSMGPVNKAWCEKHFAAKLQTLVGTGVIGRFKQAKATHSIPASAVVPLGMLANPSVNSIEVDDSDDNFLVAAVQAAQAVEVSASAEEAEIVRGDSEREQSVDSDRSVRYGVPSSVLYQSEAEEDLPRSRPSESATPPIVDINYLRGYEPDAPTAVEVINIEDESEDEGPAILNAPLLPQGPDHLVDYEIQSVAEIVAMPSPDPDVLCRLPFTYRFSSSPPRSPAPRSHRDPRNEWSPSPPPQSDRNDHDDLEEDQYVSQQEKEEWEREDLERQHERDTRQDRDPNYGRFYSYSSSAGDDYFEQMDIEVNREVSEVESHDDDSGVAWSINDRPPSFPGVEAVGAMLDVDVDAEITTVQKNVSLTLADINEGLTGKSLFLQRAGYEIASPTSVPVQLDDVPLFVPPSNVPLLPLASPGPSGHIGLGVNEVDYAAQGTINSPFDPVQVAHGMGDIQQQIDNYTLTHGQALADYLHRVNSPTPRMDESVAEMMHQVLNPTPEQDAGVVGIMRQMYDPTPQEEEALADFMGQAHQAGEVLETWSVDAGPDSEGNVEEEDVEEDEDAAEEENWEDEAGEEDGDQDEEDAYRGSDAPDELGVYSSESDHLEVESEDGVASVSDGPSDCMDQAESSAAEASEMDDEEEVVDEDEEVMEEDEQQDSEVGSDEDAPEEEPIRSIGSGAFPSPASSPAIPSFVPPAIAVERLGSRVPFTFSISTQPSARPWMDEVPAAGDPVPELQAHHRTPSISTSDSSRGPITPESTGSRKRVLEDDVEVQVQGSDDDTPPPAKALKATHGDSPNTKDLPNRTRRLASALGYIVIGAAIGTVGTIAGLMQIAEE